VTPCSLAGLKCCEGIHCFHLQGRTPIKRTARVASCLAYSSVLKTEAVFPPKYRHMSAKSKLFLFIWSTGVESQNSSDGIVIDLLDERPVNLGLISARGRVLSHHSARTYSWPTQWVPGPLSPGLKLTTLVNLLQGLGMRRGILPSLHTSSWRATP
jgi:hypothetical protein